MALAQYSKRFWFPNGTLAASVTARVFPEDSNTLATLYADAAGTTPLANPLTTTGSGVLTFWAEAGDYWIHIDSESFAVTIPEGGGGDGPFTPLTEGVSTGVLTGGELKISATPDSVDISAMTGYVVDFHTDPGQPSATPVSTPAQTVALDAASLLRTTTWWLVTADGTVVQQAARPTNSDRRTHIVLGVTRYDPAAGAFFAEQTLPQILPQLANQVFDLMDALGPFVINGNVITAKTGLSIAQSSGQIFSRADNYFAASAATRDPHVHTSTAQDPASFRYITRSSTVFPAATATVDPAHYDSGGTVTVVGGGSNRSTIQRIYLFAEHTAADQLVVQYGQTVYPTLDEAVAAVSSEAFVPHSAAVDGVLIAFLVVRHGATDLSDPAQARVISAARFGGNPAGGSSLSQLALYALLSGATFTGDVEVVNAELTVRTAAGDVGRLRPTPWLFNVTDPAYGAVGDARVVSDGAMASGSTTLTSATAAFTVDDEGKSISVKGAAATGVTTLITTIVTYVSPTQVTLAASNGSGGAVSGAIVIFGTDDTAAIQAAVDAAEAYLATHTYAQVYIPPRAFIVAGALNNTKSGNGQIVFGPIAATANKRVLEFRGEGDGAAVRHWQQTVPQHAGTCLISFGVYASTAAQIANINADGNPAIISGPNEGFGYGVSAVFANVIPVLRNIAFLNTHSSFGLTYGAFNFYGCANARLENVGWSTAGIVPGTDYTSPGVFGTGLSIGGLLPAPGNNDLVVANNISIGGGYTYAMFLTEHGLVDRYMGLYCWAGLVAVGTYFGSVGSVHAMKVIGASIEACTNELYIMGAGSSGVGPIIDIDQLSTESGTPNIAGQAAHMAAARGVVRWTGLFNEAGLTHDNPTGIESVNAQIISPVRTVTGTATARAIDRVLKADASGAGVTVNLPSAAPNPVTYTVIKTDVTGNTVTIDPSGAQTINGSATRVLSAQWESVTIRSDGSNWIAV